MAHRIFLLGSNQKRVPQLTLDCEIAESTNNVPLLWLALLDFDERRAIPVTLQHKALKNLSQRTEWLANHYSDSAQLIECSAKLGRVISDSDWKYVTLNFDDLDLLPGSKFGQSFSGALKSLVSPSKRSLSQLAKVTADDIFRSAVDDEALIGYSTAFKAKKQKLRKPSWKHAPTPRGWKADKKSARIEYTRNAQGNSWEEFEESLAKAWLGLLNHVKLEPNEWKYIFFVCEPKAGSIYVLVTESEPGNGGIPNGQRFIFKINSSLLVSEYQLVPEYAGLGYSYGNALTRLGKRVLVAVRSSAKGREIKSKIKELRKERECTLCFAIKARNHYPKITELRRF